jgi:hypothetical protein
MSFLNTSAKVRKTDMYKKGKAVKGKWPMPGDTAVNIESLARWCHVGELCSCRDAPRCVQRNEMR